MTARDRKTLIVGGAIVAVAVLGRLALMPAWSSWTEARAATAQHDAVVQDLENLIQQRDAMRNRLEARFGRGVYDAVESAEATRVAFPQAVQKALSRGGVRARQVEVQSVRPLREVPGFALLSLRIQVSCKPGQVPAMLRELARAERPTLIESFDLAMAKAGRRDEWNATLVVSTPTLREPKAGGRP